MTVDNLFAELHSKIGDIVPYFELRYKAELAHEINRLKKEKNALILGHNYMEPALFFSVTDFTGDSLELCCEARRTDKDIVVFCGVRFMAETAKILNPSKIVLLPSKEADCSLAGSITPQDVRALKQQFPGVPIVAYINTYADVKAESDICCTSANAAAIVQALESDTVIFVPDEFLARNVARDTGKHIIVPTAHASKVQDTQVEYHFIGWHGRCEVHEKFTVEDIHNVRKQYPDVLILAHPECSPEVVEESDFSGGTSAMIRYVEKTSAPRYLLLTECAMCDNVAASHRKKEILNICGVRCSSMNKITLENTLQSLTSLQFVIELPPDIIQRAARAVERMMSIV